MKQLSLDRLRTLVTVIDMGGFAKAGDYLGRSQPAISLQIKQLEQQLGKRLFSKVGQRQMANADGQRLYAKAKQMLAINDEVFSQFEQSSLRGRLQLGIPSEFASTLLPNIVGDFSQLYPDVSLEVTSSLSKHLLGENQQDFDLILALVNPAEDIGVEAEVLLEDDLVWVGHGQNSVNREQINLVLAPDGCVYRSRVIDKLKQQTTRWRISYTNADLYGLSAAMQQGLGVTALARSSVPLDLKIIRHGLLPELGKIKICLLQRHSRHPKACAKLAEFIRRRLAK